MWRNRNKLPFMDHTVETAITGKLVKLRKFRYGECFSYNKSRFLWRRNLVSNQKSVMASFLVILRSVLVSSDCILRQMYPYCVVLSRNVTYVPLDESWRRYWRWRRHRPSPRPPHPPNWPDFAARWPLGHF